MEYNEISSAMCICSSEKISEGMMESTNSLAFRRDPHQVFGGSRGGIDYMGDRDYTVIRAKLMPDSDYIPGEWACFLHVSYFSACPALVNCVNFGTILVS